MSAELITRRQVAAMLNKSYDWFLRHRKSLEADHGFPATVPGIPNRWDPLAIRAWIARGRAELEAPTPAPNDGRDWGAELDKRAGELAQGLH